MTDLAALELARRAFPTVDGAFAEIARLEAQLLLPKPTVHIVSDVHGEDKKLRHVVNNASGALRPLIDRKASDPSPEVRQAAASALRKLQPR